MTKASTQQRLEAWVTQRGIDPSRSGVHDNVYQLKDAAELLRMSPKLRAKAAIDLECSCCGALGATLVRGARSKVTYKNV